MHTAHSPPVKPPSHKKERVSHGNSPCEARPRAWLPRRPGTISAAAVIVTLALATQRAWADEPTTPTALPSPSAQPPATPSAPVASPPAAPAPDASANTAASPPTSGGVLGEFLPGPRRAPLRFHSTGAPLRVSVVANAPQLHATRFTIVETTASRFVCQTPCTLYVEGTRSFELEGPGVSSYTIDVAGPAELRLRTPSSTVTGVGAALVIAGVISTVAGASLLIADAVATRPVGAASIAFTAGGGAALVGGSVLLAVNRGGIAERRPWVEAPTARRAAPSLAPLLELGLAHATLRF